MSNLIILNLFNPKTCFDQISFEFPDFSFRPYNTQYHSLKAKQGVNDINLTFST